MSVTANTGCTWTALSNVAWMTINAGSSGSGNGTVSYTVAANTATTQRTGTMTIVGQTFTVTQGGITCTYTLTPTSKNFPSSGGFDSVAVSANTGCAWTASSNAAWITITSGSSGSGNGTVAYNVSQNTATTQRTGTMTIAGQTFTVTQDAAASCTFALSPTSKQFQSSGGSGSVNITTTSDCNWTAAGNVAWITITSNTSGSGNATVNYSVAENTSAARTGTMTIAGQTFTVTQSGPDCSTGMSINPTSKNFISAGGSDTVSVTTPSGSCQWTATSNATWASITSGDAGTGNWTVSYTVSANTTTSTRTGTMTIAGQTFTVTQDAQAGKVNLTVAITGSGTGSVSVSTGTLNWSSDGKTGTASYDKDTQVILTAQEGLGSKIKGWTGCDETIGSNQSNHCMVKMAADKTVTIEFRLPRKARHDFDGDGISDVLWRNTTTGDVAIWLMDGMKINGGDFVAKGVSSDWDVKAIGDFNGDGKADVLWQNTAGDVYIWIIEGTTMKTGGFAVRGMPGEWEVTALGDFNGDGNDDIMWRNSNSGDVYVWMMDGTDIKTGGGYVVKGMKSEWVVKAIADFNGDGTSDVLWRNTTTGDVAMWLLDGLSMSTGNYVAQAVPDNWQIKGIADFDGDSKADVLWQNTVSGDVVIWFMNGLSIANGGFVQKGVPHDWQIKVVGDYSGDGKADILWQNSSSGDVYMYIMDGLTMSGGGMVSFGMPNDWQPK